MMTATVIRIYLAEIVFEIVSQKAVLNKKLTLVLWRKFVVTEW